MVQTLTLAALDFARLVEPGDHVVWGQACGEPLALTDKLMQQRQRIGHFEVFLGISLAGSADPAFADHVRFSSFCATAGNRRLAAAGKLDILPLHYSQLPGVLGKRVDVLLLQLARHPGGSFRLAASCDYLLDLIPRARLVVAEVNAQAPCSDVPIDPASIDLLIATDYPPATLNPVAATPLDEAIAGHVAALVEDGATLQFGLGSTPEAVARLLADRRDLGLHAGILSDAAMDLITAGVITNAKKPFDQGLSVTGGLLGSSALLAFANDNPGLAMRPISYTHNLQTIARLPRFTAINSAIEVDLSGQANTETVGRRYVGTIGGALDFARGAAASKGGKAILALPSTVTLRDGSVKSRIVRSLAGPATIPRADAGIIVTEHGIADLRQASLAERARRLIAIADPRFRDELAGDGGEPSN
ncbi:acetyl-CoA hydrolase/transferase family protein [Pseudohoeflea coraliihabitans]|uniref:Acetyl-CoA hydrolase n=1 Tax=Pseudohoeflea coraliihabitans TaxID=2860393 RepID=A0ABS6WQE6_9HYPH|nr:acetyl-CoA hydrolase/transferase C-terminal domain-containing protein [Pseudohoeflea sp. DP4N28-3]MBW3098171.1 acetyl-CoA hydrolase [Pseudohoeflea sp. DP4N28-3]